MLAWIADNALTLITAAVTAAVIAAAVFSIVKDKKSGSGCSGDCASCGLNCPHNK